LYKNIQGKLTNLTTFHAVDCQLYDNQLAPVLKYQRKMCNNNSRSFLL